MLCRFRLGVGLFFACALPTLMAEQPKPISIMSAQPVTSAASSGGVVYTVSDLAPAQGAACPQCGQGGGRGSGACSACAKGCLNTCNMPQHHVYYPASHGYYYFRPYQHGHVPQQQQAVTRYGGDPRNPYDNSLFGKVYAELGIPEDVAPAEAEPVSASPPVSPAPLQPVERQAPAVPQPVEPAPIAPSPAPIVPSPAPAVPTVPPTPAPIEADPAPAPAMAPASAEPAPTSIEPQARFLRERIPAPVVKISSDPLEGPDLNVAPASPQGIVSEAAPSLEVPEPPTLEEPTPAEPQPLTASETVSLPIVSAALPMANRGEAKKLNAVPAVLNVPTRQESPAPSVRSQPVVTMASAIEFSPEGTNQAPASSPAPRKQDDARSRTAVRVKK